MTLEQSESASNDSQQVEIVFTDALMAQIVERLKVSGLSVVRTDDLLQALESGQVQAQRLDKIEAQMQALTEDLESLRQDVLSVGREIAKTNFYVDRLDEGLSKVEQDWFDILDRTDSIRWRLAQQRNF